jgi:hypothetical protein
MVSRLAKSGGFIDPVKILFRFEAFAQPIDIQKPIEMLRSGLVFHARGFLNTSAIQHNLDWIWPYWVERQYDPLDISFIPRSFLITHINITHRNWTAVGLPDCDTYSIVDPRGLLTPFWDSWSLDAWIVRKDGQSLYPSQMQTSEQELDIRNGLAVTTRSRLSGIDLTTRIEALVIDGVPACIMDISARSLKEAWLVVSVRPYNPEGVSFINTISVGESPSRLIIDRRHEISFDPDPSHYRLSYYRHGDVSTHLFEDQKETSVSCRVGMATAAALYQIGPSSVKNVRVMIPFREHNAGSPLCKPSGSWEDALEAHVPALLPEKKFQDLFDGTMRTLILLCPEGTVYPGPYTYKRFWFRDAAFILHALLCIGLFDRVEKVLDTYPKRQLPNGFFLSQEGEWDSNGEALWIMKRFCELSGRLPKKSWHRSIIRGASWIIDKRQRRGHNAAEPDELHAGLLPPGFSAEHLGPNDYYYWDDFWGVAGLRAAADLLDAYEEYRRADRARAEADMFLKAIERSLAMVEERQGRPGMPASPYRRLDSGAVGSLVSGYPLQIFPPRDERLMDTANFLLDNCLVNDGFFLDIIHSGINPYLSLHIAQTLMRAGNMNSLHLFRTVADLASPTGQWPEAIHPGTLGGCMGDGNHAWAAAEWVLMVRNSFVREEGNKLILGSGIFPSWYRKREPISFGPAPTPFGEITVRITPQNQGLEVAWDGSWRKSPPAIEVSIPGFDSVLMGTDERSTMLTWRGE